ncbi:hypothetical protein AV654_32595 [Paenibacillus elgii]|uniref:Uncharacterized protein n=1 Tax=Paenibacillus elgii TaxID=189691 RepID=A0A163UJM1_9BACL|nr:hypothetical protein AV654_32595 [Paenibacillus elgii]
MNELSEFITIYDNGVVGYKKIDLSLRECWRNEKVLVITNKMEIWFLYQRDGKFFLRLVEEIFRLISVKMGL